MTPLPMHPVLLGLWGGQTGLGAKILDDMQLPRRRTAHVLRIVLWLSMLEYNLVILPSVCVAK